MRMNALEKMKVLFVLRETPSSAASDGITRWLSNTAKAIHPTVERVDVLALHPVGSEPPSFLQEYCIKFISIPNKRASYRRLMWFVGWDSAKIRTYNPTLVRLVQQWTSEIFYDLVIFVGHGAHVYLPYVKASHTMVAPLDAPIGFALNPSGAIEKLKYRLDKLRVVSSQKSYNFADSVLVVSERDKDLLIESGVHKPIWVLPLGVDTAEFKPQPTVYRESALLFTGVMDFAPNVDAAMHLVNDIFLPSNLSSEGVVCRIAGRNPHPSVLELSGHKGVEILTNLPDLRPIFDSCMVYVAPMRKGLGMKTKILEAMAMAMPIVGYPLAFNGIANPDEFALVCNNAQEISNAIRVLLSDEQLRQDLGGKARQYVERYHSIQLNGTALLEYANFNSHPARSQNQVNSLS